MADKKKSPLVSEIVPEKKLKTRKSTEPKKVTVPRVTKKIVNKPPHNAPLPPKEVKLEQVQRALGKNETVDFQYRPGQKILHFWYGAGIIEKKSIETFNNQKKPYFVLTFNANDVIYKVPEDRIDKINIRPISTMQELEEAIKALQQNVTKAMNFKAIENECQTKIIPGRLIDVVEVIKVIYRHRKKQEKLGKISPLSTSFEKLLQTAKRLFASEWAVLKNLAYETCQQKINKMIDQYIKID